MLPFQAQSTPGPPNSRCPGSIFQKRRSRRSLLARKFATSGLALLLLLASTNSVNAIEKKADSARTRLLFLDRADLDRTKQRTRNGDPAVMPALTKLRSDADRALASPNYSVTQKTLLPPSGNKHDYMSLAPYWWPNPNTRNGLPYIRRDGELNPERDQMSDRKSLDNMIQTVKTLGIAYFFFENETYARRAAEVLRIWL
jgi:hypothetical protein